jgi:protein-L-isoaspartate(D-aspartate) O-methyltransferase
MAAGLAGKMHLFNLHFYHLCVNVFNIRKCPLKNPPSKRNAVVHTPDYRLAREGMVKNQLIPRGIKNPRVLEAMGKIPRDRFVEEALVNEAYNDHPLPIGHNQTISQPYIVALMTEALELTGTEMTLEIGTGSGYQTAILAELSKKVYTIERIRPLMVKARNILAELGYVNILFKAFDGTLGWKEYEPYDAIIVTAGAPKIPQPLLDQLAEDGRLIIPVGNKFSQELIKATKKKGNIIQKNLGGCRFVDLVGVHGWRD